MDITPLNYDEYVRRFRTPLLFDDLPTKKQDYICELMRRWRNEQKESDNGNDEKRP